MKCRQCGEPTNRASLCEQCALDALHDHIMADYDEADMEATRAGTMTLFVTVVAAAIALTCVLSVLWVYLR